MFKGLTVGKKISLLSAFLMFVTLFVGGVEYFFTKKIIQSLHGVTNNDLPAVRNMTLVDMMHDGLRAVVLNSILNSDTDAATKGAIKEEYLNMSANIQKYIANIEGVDIDQNIRDAISKAKVDVDGYVTSAGKIIDVAASGDGVNARLMMPEFMESFDVLEGSLGSLGDMIEETTSRNNEMAVSNAKRAELVIVLIIAIGIFTGVVFSFFTIRQLVTTLNEITNEIASQSASVAEIANEINSASQELSESTTEQAAAIEETVSSMEEMTSMLAQTTQNAQEGLKIAVEGRDNADNGNQVSHKMANAMDDIGSANSKLESLVGLIKEIESKTNVINDIVFETRLLSFNASIEAARAGVHGKGFAVVADEVGKLASMSGKAADEIRALLESSTKEVSSVVKLTQEKVQAGQVVSDECGTAFKTISATLSRINESVQAISLAAKEQETGVNQTNSAMSEMDRATQINSKNSERLALNSKDLAMGAGDLRNSVAKVQQLVKGQSDLPITDSKNAPIKGKKRKEEESIAVVEPIHSAETRVDRDDERWKSAS